MKTCGLTTTSLPPLAPLGSALAEDAPRGLTRHPV